MIVEAASPTLPEWYEANSAAVLDTDLLWKGGWKAQISFIAHTIHMLLVSQFDDRKERPVEVISRHISKSCWLPVYRIVADSGVEIVMRGNFHNWIVSVSSPVDIPDVFFGLFDPKQELPLQWCEGFNRDWLFGSWSDNPREFTVEVGYSPEKLYTLLFLINAAAAAAQAR